MRTGVEWDETQRLIQTAGEAERELTKCGIAPLFKGEPSDLK